MKNLSIIFSLLILSILGSCRDATVAEDLSEQSEAKEVDMQVVGKTYYISPEGNDSFDGLSTSKAWKSIDKVNTANFQPGDRILFKSGGTWEGNLAPKGSGDLTAVITIDQYGSGNKPIIKGKGTDNNTATLLLHNQSFWQINNLEITHTTSSNKLAVSGIIIENLESTPSSDISIDNCYVHNVNSSPFGTPNYNKNSGGIIFKGLINNVLVKNCHVKDCDIEGIRTSSQTKADNVVLANNIIENIYGDGIVLNGVKNSKIIGNTLRNVSKSKKTNYAGCWTYNSTGTRVAFNEVTGIKGGGPNDGEAFDADNNTKRRYF